jgi:hypothetical protein
VRLSCCVENETISDDTERKTMEESAESHLRIAKLERQVRLLSCLSLVGLIFAVLAAAISLRTTSVSASDAAQILHTRGIVIEDDHGRPRLLFGAPIPRVEGRKRRDDLTNGIVLVEENGADRLVVGDAIEVQVQGNVGKRKDTGRASGFWINDASGNERGGYITTGDDALLTLDYASSDAFHLTASSDTASLTMRAPGDHLRAMLLTDGDRPAKLLFASQGHIDLLRVDSQTAKRLPPIHSDKEFFETVRNATP